jgi:hypothetical protein
MRSIKELLLKGADRNAIDKKGNRPVDLISENVRNIENVTTLRALLA